MEHLANTYPQIVELMPIGKSSEGRILKVVKISSGANTGDEKLVKPAIWIDGGMHAREWISPAVAMFIIKQLVERHDTFKSVVEKVDWYILPMVNPDGYEYTHTNDRLWRKSRSVNEDNSLRSRIFWNVFRSSCEGVDLNRNWDFHWGETGSSDDPCHDTYSGPKALSEPETRAVADFILDHKERIQAYLTLHAYSQMWLIPWSYTKTKVEDYEDLMFMGRKAIEALKKVNGIHYDIGSSTSLLYATAGSSDDWAKGRAGIKYSYTVELRDKGSHGFLLPASQILPTGREIFAAVKAIARALAQS
uniref:Carboxypeptidase B n=2 Tax=Cacopsylla melanoneura TaxID=428564 RepID=A0A8D8VY90_9HEMI